MKKIRMRVFIGTVNGVRKYKSVYGSTKKEAAAAAEELRHQLRKGIDMLAVDSFGFWADKWLQLRKAETTPNQYINDESKVKRILKWAPMNGRWTDEKAEMSIARCQIGEIQPWHLQGIIDELARMNPHTRKPTGKKTLIDYRNVIKDIFDFAEYNRALVFNPSQRLVIPRNAPENERRALTSEEQHRICEFRHRARLPAMLMMYAGLRRGEATALLWSDVDFERKKIIVNKSFDFKQNELKAPKTKAGIRSVPLPDILIPVLQEARQSTSSVYVVTAANGRMMSDTAWKRLIESYLTDLNLKYGTFVDKPSKFAPNKAPMMIRPFTWHCLRHTYASILYTAGVDVLTAQKILGHSDIKTTLGIYTHLSAEKEEHDISKLNEYLSPAAAAPQDAAANK